MHSSQRPETGKYSFIAGDIEVEMSPEEIETHNKVKADLTIDLGTFVRKRDIGELLVDGAFVIHADAELATEPDLTFCTWESLREGRVRYNERVDGSKRFVEVVGSPDLVIEVVSQNSVRKDTQLLRQQYFKAGITEYWIIDARGHEIHFQLLVAGTDQYVASTPDEEGYRASPVLDGGVLLARHRNPVGGYGYKLYIR